jgi:ribulose-phosphate 3-epimerase
LARRVRSRGVKFGISLNPSTPLKKLKRTLDFADFILVMSVNPGFGGQAFISAVLPKIRKLRSIYKGDIAVDGGINANNAKMVIQAGANILAAGSYVFGAKEAKVAIERIRNAAQ